MTTYLTEMLSELSNFRDMTTSTMELESRAKSLTVTSWTKIMTSQTLFHNVFILIMSRVANFVDIMKIATTLIKKHLQTQKRYQILFIKMKSISTYIDITKVGDLW